MIFSSLQTEVKRRSTLDQGGNQFDAAIKNAINFSIRKIARSALWRQLRKTTTFDTETSYTTGSGGGTFTNGSKSVTMVGATLITDGIQPGRKVTLQGSTKKFVIKTITGETTFTVDINYDGTTISGTGTYEILPKEEYVLPIQVSHRIFLRHREFGNPLTLNYIPDQEFYARGIDDNQTGTPTSYRMWGENMTLAKPLEASVVTISSSSSSDTSISTTVFGTVAGYPDSEVITTNGSDGTTAVAGTKSFTEIWGYSKSASSVGRIAATTNSANVTVAVIPAGNVTEGSNLARVQLYPLPSAVFPVTVQYYLDPLDLVNAGDVSPLGSDFDEAIILLATSKLDYETNKVEGDRFFALYNDEIKSLKKVNTDKIDWFPTLQRAKHSISGRGFGSSVHPFLNYNQVGSNFGPRG